ncbi:MULTISPECIES: M56 family metallopeptidase [unclassified Ruegeria]|uniref:M56 family metallopeptidase n=1 Tax=unclassified Ruegeria TaxID=2625375 RepID=UPI0014887E8A|nr:MULTISPECIES: M56 family metallopeptidase [unclassified Ruegeria]NOD63784.1 biotin transporter BioY [Ruegeria sp. HKCCD6109]
MTAVRPVLDAYIELNIVLALSAAIWLMARVALTRTTLRHGYVAQLRALKVLCVCILISPFLALGVSSLAAHAWPGGAVALGDIAVAAYLRGDIAMPAVQFEALLNTRERWVDLALSGQQPVFISLAALFAVVAVVYAVRAFRDAVMIRQTVRSSFLWRKSAKVDIRLSDRITVPFAVRGLRRRHVVLPSHLLDTPRELRFALAHEFQHIRAGDVEWELGFELLRPLLFWNPAYLMLKYQFGRLRELACDQSVVARKRIDAREYTTCLLDYCARTLSTRNPRVLNVAFVTGGKAKRVLRQRVIALTDAQPAEAPLPALFLGMSLTFAILLALGAASIQQTQDWSHDRLMLSTVVNLERLQARNQGN